MTDSMFNVNKKQNTSRQGWSFFWYASWRMLWRDWRGGELTILAISLIIAVTSITAVGFFTDRIERGLQM